MQKRQFIIGRFHHRHDVPPCAAPVAKVREERLVSTYLASRQSAIASPVFERWLVEIERLAPSSITSAEAAVAGFRELDPVRQAINPTSREQFERRKDTLLGALVADDVRADLSALNGLASPSAWGRSPGSRARDFNDAPAMNAQEYNIFVSVNAIASGRRSRTRDAIDAVQHVFLDADDDGAAVFWRTPASGRAMLSAGGCC